MKHHSRISGIVLFVAAALPAQDRPLCIKNARLVPIEGPVVERGMLLVRDGKIQGLGTDLDVPAGALVVDAKGGTVLPGLVAAHFRLGQAQPPDGGQGMRGQRGRRGQPQAPQQMPETGGPENRAARKIVQTIYPKQEVFGELLQQGVTTLALAPSGAGFSGLGAVLDPAGTTLETLTVSDAAFVQVGPQNNTRSKELTKGELDKAKKLIDDRKAGPRGGAQSQPSSAAPASQPAASQPGGAATGQGPTGQGPGSQGPGGQRGQQPPAATQPDKNVEVLAELIEGKHKAFVELDSATDVLHFQEALGEHNFPMVLVAGRGTGNEGRLDMVLDAVKGLKAPVLLPPSLTTVALTRDLINVPAKLHAAGLEIGLTVGQGRDEARMIFYRLQELVRTGLPADAALAAVTLVPAKMLGVAATVGSLKVGKAADLILTSGDPLDPTSRVVSVWHKGKLVEKENKQ